MWRRRPVISAPLSCHLLGHRSYLFTQLLYLFSAVRRTRIDTYGAYRAGHQCHSSTSRITQPLIAIFECMFDTHSKHLTPDSVNQLSHLQVSHAEAAPTAPKCECRRARSINARWHETGLARNGALARPTPTNGDIDNCHHLMVHFERAQRRAGIFLTDSWLDAILQHRTGRLKSWAYSDQNVASTPTR